MNFFGIPILAHLDVPPNEVWLCSGVRSRLEVDGPVLRVLVSYTDRAVVDLRSTAPTAGAGGVG